MFKIKSHEENVKQKMFEIVKGSMEYSEEDVICTIDEALKLIEQKEFDYDAAYYRGKSEGLELGVRLTMKEEE